MGTPFSLYVHIPYCSRRCPYCDFNTYVEARIPEREYTDALIAELSFRVSQPEWQGRTLKTIFFGGGTPSIFHPSSIDYFISKACLMLPIDERAEISLEVNPGSVVRENLIGFRDAGINRLSFGAQSFTPHTLHSLGREHSVDDIVKAVTLSRSIGFDNISLDLMYGAPRQTLAEFKHDLREAQRLDPTHISAYGLTIEKGTPFYHRFKGGLLKLPGEGSVLRMIEELNAFLGFHGFTRYEISNYAKKSFEARHNLTYWNGEDYLGLGAGAHSFVSSQPVQDLYGKRWANFALPQSYIEAATRNGTAESWNEYLTRDSAMFEFFFLGLRKLAGVSVSEFQSRFGVSLEQLYRGAVQVLTAEELLAREGDFLRLTERGLLVSDSVIENFTTPEAASTPKSDEPPRNFASTDPSPLQAVNN